MHKLFSWVRSSSTKDTYLSCKQFSVMTLPFVMLAMSVILLSEAVVSFSHVLKDDFLFTPWTLVCSLETFGVSMLMELHLCNPASNSFPSTSTSLSLAAVNFSIFPDTKLHLPHQWPDVTLLGSSAPNTCIALPRTLTDEVALLLTNTTGESGV